ncbi:hypothetical protein acsn021_30320 [Anaerocolumna cellulosilytica]|uniref:Uncharacterized protein n=1 Tax=Anaerocolumna cellulosilytica TaxID=433286 RepID=A0A6S6QW57_9FIRM|nr:hypothetical protein acsn021_30320 [Anaerocolumna cellulosilytica]
MHNLPPVNHYYNLFKCVLGYAEKVNKFKQVDVRGVGLYSKEGVFKFSNG